MFVLAKCSWVLASVYKYMHVFKRHTLIAHTHTCTHAYQGWNWVKSSRSTQSYFVRVKQVWPSFYNIQVWPRLCIKSTPDQSVMNYVCLTVMMEVCLLILLKILIKWLCYSSILIVWCLDKVRSHTSEVYRATVTIFISI